MPDASASLLERALDPKVETPEDELSERILDAALELAAASGMRHLSMDRVAERAGVGRMTVYRRFGSRTALVDALSVREARRCLAELDATVDPGAPVADQVAQGFLTSMRLIREHPLLQRFSRSEPEAALAALRGGVFEMGRAFVAERVRAAQKTGELDPALDPEQVAELQVRLGFSFLLLPQSELPLDDDERMRALAHQLLDPALSAPR